MPRSSSTGALPDTEYFAPWFVVLVEGREVRPERRADVTEVKVNLDIGEISTCELALDNWDEEAFDFRSDFDVGRSVTVQIGYADYFTTVFHGQVTRIAPKFPESGPPTMQVTCHDALTKLKDRQPKDNEIRKYENKTDVEIAREIATRHNMAFVGTERADLRPVPLVWQKNQDDASFLMERAKHIDYDCFIVHEAEQNRDTLFFIQPSDGRSADATQEYKLEYQKNLTSFTPAIDSCDQVAKVTVRGWDPATKQVIKGEATPNDLPGRKQGKSGPDVIKKEFGEKEALVEAAVTSEEEARQLAISLLADRAYKFITGEGQMIGLPNLRPGHNLHITNVGKLFSGTYYVKSCEHVIGQRGYTTSFKVRKVFTGDGS